jgi:DNA-directed RNA polymerase specialized sigma24 family protein
MFSGNFRISDKNHENFNSSATFSDSGVREVEAMAVETSDVELMSKVKQGDREAFSALIQRHRKPLINFIYRFTTNPGISEDLAHEVLLKVFQSASKYEPRASFSTWLYRIATNLTLNYLKRLSSVIEAKA